MRDLIPPVFGSTIPEQIRFDEEHCVRRNFAAYLQKTLLTVTHSFHERGLYYAWHTKMHACLLHIQDTAFETGKTLPLKLAKKFPHEID